jgi:hypothetical protein
MLHPAVSNCSDACNPASCWATDAAACRILLQLTHRSRLDGFYRYYAQQRATDAISSNMVKDEFKRHGMEVRERQAEQQLLKEMYVVSR